MLSKILQALKDWSDGWPDQGPVPVKSTSATHFDGRANAAYSNIPKQWAWITAIPGLPNLVKEGLKEYGIKEAASTVNNPRIIAWADEVERFAHSAYNDWAADWYNKDSVPWCGLYMALISARTGRKPINKYLTALAWAGWEQAVDWRKLSNIWTGDVAVFTRSGGGHVAIIIGVSKDNKYLLCLGGNQDNMVSIKLFPVSRLYAVRRPKYRVKPSGAIFRQVSSAGLPVSTNEA
jgi:uncharacterized protein (TIGR02594 family)